MFTSANRSFNASLENVLSSTLPFTILLTTPLSLSKKKKKKKKANSTFSFVSLLHHPFFDLPSSLSSTPGRYSLFARPRFYSFLPSFFLLPPPTPPFFTPLSISDLILLLLLDIIRRRNDVLFYFLFFISFLFFLF